MIKQINENVAVIELTDHKKIEKVVVTVVDNTNIYNVFRKSGKVEVLTADNTQTEAPKEVAKLIDELKNAGVEVPNTRWFNLFIIWF
jgi:hypothetical protein